MQDDRRWGCRETLAHDFNLDILDDFFRINSRSKRLNVIRIFAGKEGEHRAFQQRLNGLSGTSGVCVLCAHICAGSR